MNKITKCECLMAGFCERHGVEKSEHLFKLCRTRPDYFDRWDKKGCSWKKEEPEKIKKLDEEYTPQNLQIHVGVIAEKGGMPLERSIRFLKKDNFAHTIIMPDGTTIRPFVQNSDIVRLADTTLNTELWVEGLNHLVTEYPSTDVYILINDTVTGYLGTQEFFNVDLFPTKHCDIILGAIPKINKEKPAALVNTTRFIDKINYTNIILFTPKGAQAFIDQFRNVPDKNIDRIELIKQTAKKIKSQIWAYSPNVCAVMDGHRQEYKPDAKYNKHGNKRVRKLRLL